MSKPRYAQIADDIRAKISAGEYAPGAKLPTNAQLMEQWTAALNTVSRALEELRNEGLVETYHGVGSFVREEPAPPPAGEESGDVEIGQLRARIEQLEARSARVDQLEAQMMEVYSNLGLAYPDAPGERRKDVTREAI